MKKILAALFITITCLPGYAYSMQVPRFLGTEKKFRSYVYNPNDVYRYTGHYTYQGFIEFENGEIINTISIGNSAAWLFEHLNNRLFLKPIEDNADTNMTVITSKRIYHFELTAKEAKNIEDPDLIFVAKFVYPDETDKNILEFASISPSDEPDMRDLSIYNFDYEFTGDNSIAPIKVFDDNKFTYFQFFSQAAELPAIFYVDSDGFESLVNFRVAGDYMVVERVASQFTLRSGNDIVCVYNNGILRQMYNTNTVGIKKQVNKNSSVINQPITGSSAKSSSDSKKDTSSKKGTSKDTSNTKKDNSSKTINKNSN